MDRYIMIGNLVYDTFNEIFDSLTEDEDFPELTLEVECPFD